MVSFRKAQSVLKIVSRDLTSSPILSRRDFDENRSRPTELIGEELDSIVSGRKERCDVGNASGTPETR